MSKKDSAGLFKPAVEDATRLIESMLDEDADHKDDILDRIRAKDLLDEEVFADAAAFLAYAIEDELRADLRYRFITGSMWEPVVMPVVENADYRKIAKDWLLKAKEGQKKAKEKATKKGAAQ